LPPVGESVFRPVTMPLKDDKFYLNCKSEV